MEATKKQLTLKERAKAPTPKLFKKITAIGASLTGAGLAMLALPFELTETLKHVAEGMMVGGVIAGVVAQLVTKEASD